MPSSTSLSVLDAVESTCPIADDARSPTTRRTQGDAGVKKTQLGLGSHHGEATWGSCGEMGETDRPADQSETGAVRATQPCEVVTGQRVLKLRPNRVTVVPQA